MAKARAMEIDLSRDFQAAIEKAKGVLLSGGLVAYPTESFYGLGVDAGNEAVIRRLFAAKIRPKTRPILILIPTIESLVDYVSQVSPIALRLAEKFWPGGLTMVFEAGPKISPLLTAGTGKIGIRLSSHPVATSLARAIGAPITGTSANISGEPACRTARQVFDTIGKKVDLILDGGETSGETASTILDMTVEPPQILREGMIPKDHLVKIISAWTKTP